MIIAHLTGETISSNSEDAFTLFEKSIFGEKKANNIEYSGLEALYLTETGKMQVHMKGKPIKFDKLLSKIKKKDKRIELKYVVFKDMRKKGYIIKTALKYGADFRVYDKGLKPSETHARWILFATYDHSALHWQDFSAKNRIAHSVNKNLLIGIVDDEGDVSYYEVAWMRT